MATPLGGTRYKPLQCRGLRRFLVVGRLLNRPFVVESVALSGAVYTVSGCPKVRGRVLCIPANVILSGSLDIAVPH